MDSKLLVSLVCPFHDEETGIDAFYQAITHEFSQLDAFNFEVLCVDDGSKDRTLELLIALSQKDSRFQVLELSRNFGKEAALTASLDHAQGDLIIPLDSDLQDPPSLIGRLIRAWEDSGADVVLAKRVDRQNDSLSKRLSAAAFYDTYNYLAHVKIPTNVGDCRLMTRLVVDALKLLPEKQRFMKGLFAWVGFKTVTIDYVRETRATGTSKFSGWKLWNFALEGITSFSSLPLRIWTYLGVIGAFITVLYGSFILIRTLIYGVDLPGYPSLFVAVLFLGSVQLIGIGVLGEYIGRTYMEVKHRPTYLIRKMHQKESISEHQQQK